jgi:hypothetical protein
MENRLLGHGANENGIRPREIRELRLTPTRLDGRARRFPAAAQVNTQESHRAARSTDAPEWINAAGPKASRAPSGRKAVIAIQHNFFDEPARRASIPTWGALFASSMLRRRVSRFHMRG